MLFACAGGGSATHSPGMLRRIASVAIVLVCLGGIAHAQPAPTRPAAGKPTLREVMQRFREVVKEQPKPALVLVTMGIGSLMWECHGHIAICAHYDNPNDDTCYNYGIGDFHRPLNMAWGFFRGTKSFWVGRQEPGELLWVYHHADRTIWIQPLPLTLEQNQAVIAKLETDVQDANRYYAYDHFWDNCTTRVRNVLDDATGGALSSMKDPPDGRTFRDLARDGFYGMRVPLLITDIAMGRVTDRVPSYWERMFLPDYLREAAHKRWDVAPIAIYERIGPPPLRDGPSGRVWMALLVVLLTAPAWITRLWGRFERAGMAIAVIPPAFLGLVFWGLAVISPLPYVRWNETALILIPLDILLLVLSPQRRQLYARGRLAMLAVIAILMAVDVIKAPLWMILLWPAIPAAVVGFWPPRTKHIKVTVTDPVTDPVVAKPAVAKASAAKRKRA